MFISKEGEVGQCIIAVKVNWSFMVLHKLDVPLAFFHLRLSKTFLSKESLYI